jgi:hypothetical protein
MKEILMETSFTDLGITAQDNVLSAMETSKSFVLESVKAWTATTKKMMPDMSALPGTSVFGDLGSGPMGAVTMTYDFAEKVLASQRSLVEELIDIVAPASA